MSKYKDQAVQTDVGGVPSDSGYKNKVSKYKYQDKAVQADAPPSAYVDMACLGEESADLARPAPSARSTREFEDSHVGFGAAILNQMSKYKGHGRFMADYSRTTQVMLMSSVWRHIEYAMHEPGNQSAVGIFKDLAHHMVDIVELEGDEAGARVIRQLAAVVEIRASNRCYSRYGDRPRTATSACELGGRSGGSSSSTSRGR